MNKLPEQLYTRLVRQFGANAADGIIAAFSCDRSPTFRVNTLKSSDESVMTVLREAGVQFERVKNVPHAFLVKNRTSKELLESPLAASSAIYLQGLTSMLPAIILNPQPNEKVLDMCAAPGSKTTQLAAMFSPPFMGESEGVVACENDTVRFQKLVNTIRVQGANVDARNVDATLLHHEMPEAFDKILVDAPCSAEGRIDLRDKRSFSFWNEKNIVAHAKLQRRLLRSAVLCLKQGGTLVYSTCTLAPEENEHMIDWFLAEYPAMRAEPVTLPFAPAIVHKNKSVTLLPSKVAEGFFVAKLVKTKKPSAG